MRGATDRGALADDNLGARHHRAITRRPARVR
jgi:hypothetical protein